MHKSHVTALAVAAGIAVLSGCATTQGDEETTLALNRAENSVRLAEQQQAASFAAFELEAAKTRLSAAQEAAGQGEDRTARARAQEAQADAELAAAKSDLSATLNQGGRIQRTLNNENSIQTMPAPGAR